MEIAALEGIVAEEPLTASAIGKSRAAVPGMELSAVLAGILAARLVPMLPGARPACAGVEAVAAVVAAGGEDT